MYKHQAYLLLDTLMINVSHIFSNVGETKNCKTGDFVDRIYPIEFEIKDTTNAAKFSHCELPIYML